MLAGVFVQPGVWDPGAGVADGVLLLNLSMSDVQTPVVAHAGPGHRLGEIRVSNLTAHRVTGPATCFAGNAALPGGRVHLHGVQVGHAAEAVRRDPVEDLRPEDDPHGGRRVLDRPAWGLYAADLDRLDCSGVELEIRGDDPRPAVATARIDPALPPAVPLAAPPGERRFRIDSTPV